MNSSKLLIIVDNTPAAEDHLANLIFKETIDAALGVAAFGIKVSIWFSGKGVNCLQQAQQFKIIEALEYYDIENLYATCEDLNCFQIDIKKTGLFLSISKQAQFSLVLENYQTILRMN